MPQSGRIAWGVRGGGELRRYATRPRRRRITSPASGHNRLRPCPATGADPGPGGAPGNGLPVMAPGPAPVLGGFFAPTQLKIQTLARSPAATTTRPCPLTLSDSA